MTERHEHQPTSTGTYRPGEPGPMTRQPGAQGQPASTQGQSASTQGQRLVDQGQQGGNQGQRLADQATQTLDQAKEKGQEAAGAIKEKGQEAAGALEDRVNQGIDRAAEATQGLADTLRSRAPSLPGDKTTDLAYQAATGLEQGAQYLRQADMGAMRGDLEGVIRRYPTQSLAVGLALGFLLARAFR